MTISIPNTSYIIKFPIVLSDKIIEYNDTVPMK